MRRFLLLLPLLFLHTTPLWSTERGVRLEQKIMNRILRALTGKSAGIHVYFAGRRLPQSLLKNPDVILTPRPENADVVLVGSRRPDARLAHLHKPLLTLDYGTLRDYPNAVGAYFWQKGRPNIIMIRARLDRERIRLPAEFDRYIEDSIW